MPHLSNDANIKKLSKKNKKLIPVISTDFDGCSDPKPIFCILEKVIENKFYKYIARIYRIDHFHISSKTWVTKQALSSINPELKLIAEIFLKKIPITSKIAKTVIHTEPIDFFNPHTCIIRWKKEETNIKSLSFFDESNMYHFDLLIRRSREDILDKNIKRMSKM
jgi:hypothetical protein